MYRNPPTETNVPLAAPVPIYMLYLTAWVGEDGIVNFRDDVYDRDRKLSANFPEH